MAKNEMTKDEVDKLIDKLVKELGLLKSETSSATKLQGPVNKHRMYVFKSKFLGRIDFTVALPVDDPSFLDTVADNGSISCHVKPDKESLERTIRMLADDKLGVQIPNKPRPFAATRQPPPRKPKEVELPVDVRDTPSIPVGDDGRTIAQRLAEISERVRIKKIDRLMEEHGFSRDDAMAVVDKKVDLSDMMETRRSSSTSELNQLLSESGIEVGDGT